MAESPLPVVDKPTEIWIKLLFFITAIAVGLLSYIGNRVIEGQDRMTMEISKINGFIQVFSGEISTLKATDKEIFIRIEGNTREIYKLKGAK